MARGCANVSENMCVATAPHVATGNLGRAAAGDIRPYTRTRRSYRAPDYGRGISDSRRNDVRVGFLPRPRERERITPRDNSRRKRRDAIARIKIYLYETRSPDRGITRKCIVCDYRFNRLVDAISRGGAAPPPILPVVLRRRAVVQSLATNLIFRP